MTQFERNVAEAARELNISTKDAMTLEFIHMHAMAELAKSNKSRAVAALGLAHLNGQITADEMRNAMTRLGA